MLTQSHGRHAKDKLGVEALGLHLLQRAESLGRTIAAEGESADYKHLAQVLFCFGVVLWHFPSRH